MSDVIKPFKGQNFHEIRAQHNSNSLFEDSLFPADNTSLCFNRDPPDGIVWLRPKEVNKNAKFCDQNGFKFDLDYGPLGNCWFVSACLGIMQNRILFGNVVPENQSLTDNYTGAFHFRFWSLGDWYDVVIDDRLPFWTNGNLVYTHHKSSADQYWGPLLEKAYAKFLGCYESLNNGQILDALLDMTGGIQERFYISKDKKLNYDFAFWRLLEQSFSKKSIVGCSVFTDPRIRESRMSNGSVKDAFTITGIFDLKKNNLDVKLIRIQNPWSKEKDWNGPWSEGTKEWKHLTDEEKKEVGFFERKEGEFWMCFPDFMSYWDQVQICHLSLDSTAQFTNILLDDGWECKTYHSEWKSGSTAGGSGTKLQAKFWMNPQFLFTLPEIDQNIRSENKTDVIIALMQKSPVLKRLIIPSIHETYNECIQFKLYKVKDEMKLDETKTTGHKLHGLYLDKIGSSGSYINSKEVHGRFKVQPGRYLIIPSTYEENRDCEFLLRIFTEKTQLRKVSKIIPEIIYTPVSPPSSPPAVAPPVYQIPVVNTLAVPTENPIAATLSTTTAVAPTVLATDTQPVTPIVIPTENPVSTTSETQTPASINLTVPVVENQDSIQKEETNHQQIKETKQKEIVVNTEIKITEIIKQEISKPDQSMIDSINQQKLENDSKNKEINIPEFIANTEAIINEIRNTISSESKTSILNEPAAVQTESPKPTVEEPAMPSSSTPAPIAPTNMEISTQTIDPEIKNTEIQTQSSVLNNSEISTQTTETKPEIKNTEIQTASIDVSNSEISTQTIETKPEIKNSEIQTFDLIINSEISTQTAETKPEITSTEMQTSDSNVNSEISTQTEPKNENKNSEVQINAQNTETSTQTEVAAADSTAAAFASPVINTNTKKVDEIQVQNPEDINPDERLKNAAEISQNTIKPVINAGDPKEQEALEVLATAIERMKTDKLIEKIAQNIESKNASESMFTTPVAIQADSTIPVTSVPPVPEMANVIASVQVTVPAPLQEAPKIDQVTTPVVNVLPAPQSPIPAGNLLSTSMVINQETILPPTNLQAVPASLPAATPAIIFTSSNPVVDSNVQTLSTITPAVSTEESNVSMVPLNSFVNPSAETSNPAISTTNSAASFLTSPIEILSSSISTVETSSSSAVEGLPTTNFIKPDEIVRPVEIKPTDEVLELIAQLIEITDDKPEGMPDQAQSRTSNRYNVNTDDLIEKIAQKLEQEQEMPTKIEPISQPSFSPLMVNQDLVFSNSNIEPITLPSTALSTPIPSVNIPRTDPIKDEPSKQEPVKSEPKNSIPNKVDPPKIPVPFKTALKFPPVLLNNVTNFN